MHERFQAISISISINRDWRDLYEEFWHPTAFPAWATGLSGSTLEQDGAYWTADGPDGPIRILFTDHNPYGVMDHHVELGDGQTVYIPLRVIANGSGSEVVLTLFRQPGMSDEKFQADIAWVRRDLEALKAIAMRTK